MRIQELEQQTGLDRATIRFYEKEGLIIPDRSENGYRDYSEENIQELHKIRLLRKLGMSIPTIRALQQGSGDFLHALDTQANALSAQIEEDRRARELCLTIRKDAPAYHALDAEYYLRQFEQPGNFQEDVPRQIHPWRRYFARTLDYFLFQTFLRFLFIVVLRIRGFYSPIWDHIYIILSMAAFVPAEAWMLSKWGTTPGKWMFGIRLESVQGGHLSFREALDRAWNVYTNGACIGIPVLATLSYIQWYCVLTGRSTRRFAKYDEIEGPADMAWDHSTELIYESIGKKRTISILLSVIICVFLSVFSGFNNIFPKYRTEYLTIPQFSANYNHLISVLDLENEEMLAPDGTKVQDPSQGIVLESTTGEIYVPKQFQYDTVDGFIQSISIERYWSGPIVYVNPMSSEEINLALTFLLSQPDCRIRDVFELLMLLKNHELEEEVSLNCSDLVRIVWNIDTQNCFRNDSFYITQDPEGKSSLEYFFSVRIP